MRRNLWAAFAAVSTFAVLALPGVPHDLVSVTFAFVMAVVVGGFVRRSAPWADGGAS